MSLPIKTYWNGMTRRWYRQAKFIQKHRTVIIAVLTAVDPASVVAVTAAIDALLAAVSLIEAEYKKIDPNGRYQ
jgi:hypothetical protein